MLSDDIYLTNANAEIKKGTTKYRLCTFTEEMWHAICYAMYVYGWKLTNSLLQYSYSRQRATEVIFLWLKNVGFHFVCGCESGCYFKRKFSTAADMNLCECESRIGAYGTQISRKCLQRWRENFFHGNRANRWCVFVWKLWSSLFERRRILSANFSPLS